MDIPSKHLQEAVEQFSMLPGIGKRTALRLVLYLLKQSSEEVEAFGKSFINMRNEIQFCQKCHNVSDQDICSICANHKRNQQQVCVVEDMRDVIAIENTSQYNGVYHVLGGVISPMDGIGPNDLNIESLLLKAQDNIQEVIFALPTTMEGDTTNFYLFKKLSIYEIKMTTLAL